jgi:hypothetical protein
MICRRSHIYRKFLVKEFKHNYAKALIGSIDRGWDSDGPSSHTKSVKLMRSRRVEALARPEKSAVNRAKLAAKVAEAVKRSNVT